MEDNEWEMTQEQFKNEFVWCVYGVMLATSAIIMLTILLHEILK